MFEKHLWKSDILSKDVDRWPEKKMIKSMKCDLKPMFSSTVIDKLLSSESKASSIWMVRRCLITLNFSDTSRITAWNVCKYGVISVPYFSAFGPEKTLYLDTFHTVNIWRSLPDSPMNLFRKYVGCCEDNRSRFASFKRAAKTFSYNTHLKIKLVSNF